MENKLHEGNVFIVPVLKYFTGRYIFVGGLEAQLCFSGEGINIPDGFHNKPVVTPCNLKPEVLPSPSETCDSMAFEYLKTSKDSKAEQGLQQNQSIHPSINQETQKR